MSRSLLSQTASQLVAATTAGQLSAVELLEACRKRVAEVNPALNALVVARWDEALVEARAADQAQRTGMPLGPLHGLPVTIKEMFDVAGLPTTAGIARRRLLPVTHDADAVRRWRQAGAIVVGKTNVPQMGILAESDNPVYGRTNNPWDLDRGPGGSSGGEAALIAAGGSPLGLASDGGGSIRQPAHACGICGFKPTGGRLSTQGHWLSTNWPGDWVQPGPMARCVADLQLGYRALCERPDGPPFYGAVPAPESAQPPSLDGLRVGMYEQLEDLPVMASVSRALRLAAAALTDAGIEVVPIRFERAGAMWDLYTAVLYAEGLRDMRRQVRGSAVDWRVRESFRLVGLPGWLRKPSSWLSRAIGQARVARLVASQPRPVLSAEEYCRRLIRVQAMRLHFARRLQRSRVGALLGPASPVPAFPHGELYATYSLMYTGIFNMLGVPAGVLPVTQVQDDEMPSRIRPRDWVDRSLWRAQSSSAGLPIGVQIIGPWWGDERVLALMQTIEQRVGFRAEPSLAVASV